MELNIWTKRYFDENSKIEWPCPYCNTSSLNLNKDKLNHEETANSKKFRSENEDWEIEWIQLVFNGQLTCKNCGEVVFFTGTGNPEELKYELSGFWSRRINKKDRLIYEVQEEVVTVFVVSAFGHY